MKTVKSIEIKTDHEIEKNKKFTMIIITFEDGSAKYVAMTEPFDNKLLASSLRNLAMMLAEM